MRAKRQGWSKRFEVRVFGTSYDEASLDWFGRFYGLPRLGWYFGSQFLYSPAERKRRLGW